MRHCTVRTIRRPEIKDEYSELNKGATLAKTDSIKLSRVSKTSERVKNRKQKETKNEKKKTRAHMAEYGGRHSPLRAFRFHDGELAGRRGIHHLLFDGLVYLGAECLYCTIQSGI
jgi:hypothetical protein